MFNLKGRDADAKDAGKSALKPAHYDPVAAAPKAVAATVPRGSPLTSAPLRDALPAATQPAHAEPPSAMASAAPVADAAQTPEPPGSKLAVGINIKLKGVEISDCDILVIEGHVQATVHSKAMQIAKPGTLEGIAEIDVAEIYGNFSGELTARKRLVVHGTGRVAGTIRYGQLVVAEGGELSGDVKRLDATDKPSPKAREPGTESRPTQGLVYERH